jgi:hypothetical protein
MRGIIYCIKEKDKGYDSPIYIGSTKDFKERTRLHKRECNNPNRKGYNIKVYQYIRDNGGWDNFEMLVVDILNYTEKKELKKEEQLWMNYYNSKLNSVNAVETVKAVKSVNTYKKINNHRLCECGSVVKSNELDRHRLKSNHKERMYQAERLKNLNKDLNWIWGWDPNSPTARVQSPP